MKKILLTLLLIFFTLPHGVRAQEVILSVPFSPQAPDAHWVEPWENACEETSIVMIHAYYTGQTLNKNTAKVNILSVLRNKNKNEGKSKDESPEKVVNMMNRTGQWSAHVEKSFDVEKIKKEINEKRPVLVPFDATKVNNPNFQSNIVYHMVVVIGYDDEKQIFLVHDPGTSRGEKFQYGYTELKEANTSFLIRDTGEVLGNQVIFTSPEKIIFGNQNKKGFFQIFWEKIHSWFS